MGRYSLRHLSVDRGQSADQQVNLSAGAGHTARYLEADQACTVGFVPLSAWVSTQFINPMILKEPPNHTATPNYHSRASGNPVLTRGIWIPACAGMTIYSRCVDTYALRGERSEGGEAGGDEGRGPRMRQRQNYVIYSWGTTLATYRWSAAYRDSPWLEKSPESYN